MTLELVLNYVNISHSVRWVNWVSSIAYFYLYFPPYSIISPYFSWSMLVRPPLSSFQGYSGTEQINGILGSQIYVWGFPRMGVPQNGWFVMEKPSINGWFRGTPMTLETSIMRVPPNHLSIPESPLQTIHFGMSPWLWKLPYGFRFSLKAARRDTYRHRRDTVDASAGGDSAHWQRLGRETLGGCRKRREHHRSCVAGGSIVQLYGERWTCIRGILFEIKKPGKTSFRFRFFWVCYITYISHVDMRSTCRSYSAGLLNSYELG